MIDTLRLRLLKIGTRVVEKVARIRMHFTSACTDGALFRLLAGRLAVSRPVTAGAPCPANPRSFSPHPDTTRLR